MGIRRLKHLLTTVCTKNDKFCSGIYHFTSVNTFLQEEKKRLYHDSIKECHVANPIKQMQLKKNINNTPYTVGIDANLYIAKYSRIFKRIEYGFLRQILLTLSSRMVPLYIFDGNPPEQKKNTINNRRNKKRKNRNKLNNLLCSKGVSKENLSCTDSTELFEHINSICDYLEILPNRINTSHLLHDYKNSSKEYEEIIKLYKRSINVSCSDIVNLQHFLDLLKIPYVTANNEADDMLAYLYHCKIIQACQSDDMDMLPKGCGNLIQITDTGVDQYLLSEILDELKLTQNQFIDLCVLLGSDYYNAYLPKMDTVKLYNHFKSLGNPSLENFVESYSTIDPSISLHLDSYLKARKSLNIACNESLEKLPNIHLVPLSTDRIIEYLENLGMIVKNRNFSKIFLYLKNANTYINELTLSPLLAPTITTANSCCYSR